MVNVENLPRLRQRMSEIIDNYHNAQQNLLETFVDRGQLRSLAERTTLGQAHPRPQARSPRQMAVMHALVRFANIAAGSTFTTSEVYAPALDALGSNAFRYSLAPFRCGLSKLRAKGPVEWKDPSLPALPYGRQRILGVPDLLEVIRAYLRRADGWAPQTPCLATTSSPPTSAPNSTGSINASSTTGGRFCSL